MSLTVAQLSGLTAKLPRPAPVTVVGTSGERYAVRHAYPHALGEEAGDLATRLKTAALVIVIEPEEPTDAAGNLPGVPAAPDAGQPGAVPRVLEPAGQA